MLLESAVYLDYEACDKPLVICKILKRLPGSALSLLSLADDGRMFVLKCVPSRPGPNVVANEYWGNRLLYAAGLPVPDARAAWLDQSVVYEWRTSSLGASDLRLPEPGLQLAVESLHKYGAKLFQSSSEQRIKRTVRSSQDLDVTILDLWANHRDRRQRIERHFHSTDHARVPVEVFYIDNGHLFGGPDWKDIDADGIVKEIVLLNLDRDLVKDRLDRLRAICEKFLDDDMVELPGRWRVGNVKTLKRSLYRRLTHLEKDFFSIVTSSSVPNHSTLPLISLSDVFPT